MTAFIITEWVALAIVGLALNHAQRPSNHSARQHGEGPGLQSTS